MPLPRDYCRVTSPRGFAIRAALASENFQSPQLFLHDPPARIFNPCGFGLCELQITKSIFKQRHQNHQDTKAYRKTATNSTHPKAEIHSLFRELRFGVQDAKMRKGATLNL